MPTDRERLEALARYPTKLCTYEDGAAIRRTLDALDEMARTVQRLEEWVKEVGEVVKSAARHPWRALQCPNCGGAAREHIVTHERDCSDCNW